MYWYNLTTHSSEKVSAPSSDSQAIQMLCRHSELSEFVQRSTATYAARGHLSIKR